jgi:hypothetical protein
VNQIFLDCDGVLADFDTFSFQLFGQHPRAAEAEIGEEEFWNRIRNHGNFYRELPLLTDAMELYQAIAHLNPIILTGCPKGGWAEAQKLDWALHHFPTVRIITCRARDKRRHMQPGDILVDDYLKYRDLWESAGGIFVHHTSAGESIAQLAKLGLPLRQ